LISEFIYYFATNIRHNANSYTSITILVTEILYASF
jgi:hypothetical protein